MSGSDRHIMLSISSRSLLVIMTIAASTAAGGEFFRPPILLETGSQPTYASIADVSDDECNDLLILNIGSNDLLVFAGDCQGGFEPKKVFAAGPNPDSLAVGDLDNDGDVDIAIANHETRQLTLLTNDSSGAFRPFSGSPLTIDVSPHAHAVQAVDFDRDGNLDLLVDDRDGGGYVLLVGEGNGEFAEARRIYAGGDPYLGMAIADLNKDSRPDIVAPLGQVVNVVLSSQSAYLPPRRVANHGAFGVALGDVDADGLQDLAIAAENGNFSLLRGTGDGLFEPLLRRRFSHGAKRTISGDFNGDKAADFVIQNYSGSPVFVLLGGEEPKIVSVESGEHPWGLAAGDLNGDQVDDLVSLDQQNDLAYILLAAPES